MVATIIPIDLSVSWGASGFSPISRDFAKDLGVSSHVVTLGLSMYVLGLAFGPLSLAPLSEWYGRRPVYIVSYGIFLLLLLGTTYVKSLGLFLVLRFFSGYFSSTTISNFGGTIADLFHRHDTGPAMSLFIWAGTGGSPTGFVLFSLIAYGRSWRISFRIMFVICFAFWITYTEDAYRTYSASALAGIGFVRNLAGAGFPVLGRALFLNIGTRNAGLVLMAIAVCLTPIPFELEQRGLSLRKRSPWAAALEEEEEDSAE